MAKSQVLGLFPGQGSQQVGMGKELYENFKIAKQVFEEASDSCHLNLKKLCFDGPSSDLLLTEFTQPCLLTTSVAAFRVAQAEAGIELAAVAGHSLGEYSALVCAESIPLAQAAFWVRERGKAMQVAVPAGQGGMAAIMGLHEKSVLELCERATSEAKAARAQVSGSPEDFGAEEFSSEEYSVEAIVEPANFNSPGQIVIAGSKDGIDHAVGLVKAGEFPGGKAIVLAVSAPFHCKLMAPARARMAELFELAKTGDQAKSPRVPYVPNRTARKTSEGGVVFELLIDQIDHPVLWQQSMTSLLQEGFSEAIEFGSGKVLAGLMKRISEPFGKTLPGSVDGRYSYFKGITDQEHAMSEAIAGKRKVALITGSSRGIGASIARRLARDGYQVILNFTQNEAKASQLLKEITESGGSGSLAQFDVSKSDQVDEKFAQIQKEFGPIAVLVNNAGITIDGLLVRMKDEDLDRTLEVDLKGAIYCTRAAAKQMMRERAGSIIQISSVIGEQGNAGQAAYSAAKAGLIGFAKSVAKELGSRNIRVNVVTPGFITTDMTGSLTEGQKEAILRSVPLGSLGAPEDVAALVAFLASPDSRYITGQVIGVNGGMYM